MIIESGMKLKGRLSWEVINKDGSVDNSSGGLYDNLILNSGLDLIGPSGGSNQGGGEVILNVFKYCAVGTSNATPNVSQSGFMTTEVARTNAYNTSAGMCGTEYKLHFEGNYIKYYRTFDFPKGTFNNESLAEVGFSPYSTKADNLWSRALFKVGGIPTTVSVSPTQILRIRYELTIQFDTAWNTGKSVNIAGTSYGYKDAFILKSTHEIFWKRIESNGNITNTSYGTSLNPAHSVYKCSVLYSSDVTTINNYAFISSNTMSVTDFGSLESNPVKSSYVAGNYFIDLQFTFDTSKFNTTFNGIKCGSGDDNTIYNRQIIIFDTPFTKDSLHEMIITFRMSWGRA